MTHRSDESGRVSLAGCSPAEPASVSSTHSGYQSFYARSVSDPPAGPRVFRGCARGLRLSIHLTVCFEAGRFTLAQSSWTASARRCSRKWMSGHAAKALVLISDRGQPKIRTPCSLGEPTPPGQRESPFPLDHYLSWMSTKLFSPQILPRWADVWLKRFSSRSHYVEQKGANHGSDLYARSRLSQ